MENSSNKKYWIIALAIPITIIGLFIISLVYSYNSYVQKGATETNIVSPDYDLTSDSRSSMYTEDALGSTGNENIVRTASTNVSVDDIDSALISLKNLNDDYDAQITNLQDSGKGVDRTVYVTIKVEETKFEELYDKIKELPGEFTYSSVESYDITETVQDLESRLSNLKALETQLNSILTQAKTVTDILEVQKELNTTRTEIESIETQLKNYENQTKYSYISVSISQSSTGSALSDEKWLPLGVLKDAARALVSFAKFLGTGLIYVLVFSPVIAAVVVPVILIQKKNKK